MADRVGQLLGNYYLVRLLGQGGFAEVYLGEHVYLKSQAAIKVLHTQLVDEERESFLAEARTLGNLIHPHIVRVLDFGVEDTTPFLVMEYAPNGSLRQRHPKGVRLALFTVQVYVKQVAAALQYLHQHKVIHRDVKPENMLLGQRNEVLLSDFGVAVVAQSSRHHGTDPQQMAAGTIGYMAPEQIASQPRLASDQYALGIVVYEWLCGHRPFVGSFIEVVAKHGLVPPPPLRERVPSIPLAVEQVVHTALEKDPSKRFASVQAFADAFAEACQAGVQGSIGLSGGSTTQEGLAPEGLSQAQQDANAPPYSTSRAHAAEPPAPSDSETMQHGQLDVTTHEWSMASDETLVPADIDTVFLFNGPLTDAEEFYGRARERETLRSRSRKGASTSLVGPRRIGKTWLMSYLRLVAPTMLGAHCRVGYVDATLASCATVAGFTARALEELDVASLVPDSAQMGLTILERVMQELKSRNQKVLLCIDEFEGFGKTEEFTLDFYTGLRALTQIGLCLVVASRSPLIDIVGDNGKTSGFFNVFEQLTLEAFSVEEAQAFAQAKSSQAGFTDQERGYLLQYGRVGEEEWPPIRLQLVGKMLLEDKTLAQREGSHYYSPNDPRYWQKFEQRLEEKYRGVVR